MQINLQITYSGGNAKSVTAIAADLVAFENHFDLSVAKLEQNIRLTYVLFLAWSVEKRTKATELGFDAWVETVESVELAEAKK
jgi:hypothetical protein